MIKLVSYWMDKNHNKWDTEIFSKEDAEKLSETLIDCVNCINCQDLSNCHGCMNCEKCANLENSINCKGWS